MLYGTLREFFFSLSFSLLPGNLENNSVRFTSENEFLHKIINKSESPHNLLYLKLLE